MPTTSPRGYPIGNVSENRRRELKYHAQNFAAGISGSQSEALEMFARALRTHLGPAQRRAFAIGLEAALRSEGGGA